MVMKMKNLNLTNEEFCHLAKNGDNRAVEILINNNLGFIKRLQKRYPQNMWIQLNLTIWFRKDRLLF